MKGINKEKIKLLDLSFLLLACYPLLRFHHSSSIFIAFCLLCLYTAIKLRKFYFSKKDIKYFVFSSFYFFMLAGSILYSENSKVGVDIILRMVPLIIVPFILFFFKPTFSQSLKIKALNVFLFANLIYSIVLFVIFIIFRNDPIIEGISSDSFFLNFDKTQHILDSIITDDLLFIHKSYFSMGFVFSAIFALHQSIKHFNENKLKGLFYLSMLFYFSGLVIFSFSFPNILALAVCLLFYFLFEIRNAPLKRRVFILPASLLIVCVVLGVYYKTKDIDVKRGMNFINSVVQNKNVEGNDARIEIYRTYKGLLDKASFKNILIGYGIGDEQDLLHKELANRIDQGKNKNLLFFNEEFNDGYWFKTNVEIKSNMLDSPFETKTADLLIETNTKEVVSHNISTEINLDKDKIYTFSVYAKKSSSETLVLRLGPIENRAYFDLEKDIVISKYEGIITANIESLGNGWNRCSISVTGNGQSLAILGLSDPKGTYNYVGNNKELYIWGAQIEKGEIPSAYLTNNSELMNYAYERNLNTHNNYLFFLLTTGIIGLLAFLFSLFLLFRFSLKNKNILQWSFCIIIALNFLTENILSRHWGLMFVSVMVLILFTSQKPNNNVKEII